MAGFAKRVAIHSYTQNVNALALVISEKIVHVFVVFFDCNAKVANELLGPFLAPGATSGACFA